MEETGRPAALVETISGSLAVTVPLGEPAPAITLDLALDGVRDLVKALGLVLAPAQELETGRDLDRAAVLAPEMGRHQVAEVGQDLGRAVTLGWATEGGGAVEAGRGLGREVVPAGEGVPDPEAGLTQAAELVRVHTPEQSSPEWAGGSPLRHY